MYLYSVLLDVKLKLYWPATKPYRVPTPVLKKGISHRLLVKPMNTLTYGKLKKVWQLPPTLLYEFHPFFFPALVCMDVFNQKPFPLKHALTQRVSKPLCNRQSSGEFIWWRALLDLFVAPKRLKTRKLPLFCSDKWFWWEGGWRKSVCESSPKTLGFFTA